MYFVALGLPQTRAASHIQVIQQVPQMAQQMPQISQQQMAQQVITQMSQPIQELVVAQGQNRFKLLCREPFPKKI